MTHTVNMYNTRRNVLIPFEGEMLSPKQIEARTGVLAETIRRRYFDFGITGEKLWLKDQRKTLVLFEGKQMTVKAMARLANIPYAYLLRSFRAGHTVADTLTRHAAGKSSRENPVTRCVRGLTLE